MTSPKYQSDRLELFRRIVRDHQCEEVDGIMIDAQTANAVCTVYDNLQPANQDKFISMDIGSIGIIAWEVLSKSKEAKWQHE